MAFIACGLLESPFGKLPKRRDTCSMYCFESGSVYVRSRFFCEETERFFMRAFKWHFLL